MNLWLFLANTFPMKFHLGSNGMNRVSSMVLAALCAALWAMTAPEAEAQAPTVLDEFQGIRFQQYPGTAATPPDISGAVGEDGILEVVNVSAVYFPKVGGVARQQFSGGPGPAGRLQKTFD